MKTPSLSLRQLLRIAGICLAVGALIGWWYCKNSDANASNVAVKIVLDWNKFILSAEVNTEGYRGPIAARAYAYVGLAAYEAALPGMEGQFSSLTEKFSLLKLPTAPPKEHFNMELALNESYATMIGKLFLTAPENIRSERIELEKKWKKELSENLDSVTVSASVSFGQLVAEAVYDWSSTDSLGYLANHHNYDRSYQPPSGEGLWVTSVDFPMPALLPYWGKVRPFVIDKNDFIARPLPLYSISPNDIYYHQALEIVSLSKPLSAENQWIAEFWNDDRPGLTFSPAGHWLSITSQVVASEHPTIEKTLETYLKIGFAISDASVACFNSKYIYNFERPESYIQDHIDKNWRPFSPSPSFPSYPSGHAMIGSASAAVLSALYGAAYKMTDKSHQELKAFSVRSRTFTSFDEMANENAISRVFLGVHWRFDCDEGLRLGNAIGKQVSSLQLETPLN